MGALRAWQFCPRCRADLTNDGSRVDCAACGFVRYANPLPAVAALVLDAEGNLLLARRAVEPDAGKWDTIGGFLEEHEDAIDALHREVLEETSLRVDVGEFVGAYTDRYGDGDDAPFALNLVWEARLRSGELQPADDVSELRWFAPDQLPSEDALAFEWLPVALREWASSDAGR